ncbi:MULTISPECIES: hypothetical protein [unclassified Beijerinckia]|uniref:hypothetical protein n=1 Tax=unclassified Beijerinckia TaxID=2638183 RepID=UPI00089D8949|nr:MULTISPECIES: hypothetical protein [unclassified Beijerinckia]MDH7797508.1 hypothetical protein [Beijerinckia sp. GAS462]SEC88384.1 hypothetical protein SAMN05443249_3802 [Beijerinckia sp. 28-YEA-48]
MSTSLRPDILAALDRFISEQPDPKPTLEQAIAVAVENFLISMGLLEIPPDDEAYLA